MYVVGNATTKLHESSFVWRDMELTTSVRCTDRAGCRWPGSNCSQVARHDIELLWGNKVMSYYRDIRYDAKVGLRSYSASYFNSRSVSIYEFCFKERAYGKAPRAFSLGQNVTSSILNKGRQIFNSRPRHNPRIASHLSED